MLEGRPNHCIVTTQCICVCAGQSHDHISSSSLAADGRSFEAGAIIAFRVFFSLGVYNADTACHTFDQFSMETVYTFSCLAAWEDYLREWFLNSSLDSPHCIWVILELIQVPIWRFHEPHCAVEHSPNSEYISRVVVRLLCYDLWCHEDKSPAGSTIGFLILQDLSTQLPSRPLPEDGKHTLPSPKSPSKNSLPSMKTLAGLMSRLQVEQQMKVG